MVDSPAFVTHAVHAAKACESAPSRLIGRRAGGGEVFRAPVEMELQFPLELPVLPRHFLVDRISIH
jgi:hypothetical protein